MNATDRRPGSPPFVVARDNTGEFVDRRRQVGGVIGMDDEQLLSVADAARTLERSTEQVRRYLREGRLRGRRLGGQWFIDAAELTAFQSVQRERQSFLSKLKPAAESDPLGAVIGIGAGGGTDLANGKDAYRRAFWWRR
jgi:excisionase family DNA binding protein